MGKSLYAPLALVYEETEHGLRFGCFRRAEVLNIVEDPVDIARICRKIRCAFIHVVDVNVDQR